MEGGGGGVERQREGGRGEEIGKHNVKKREEKM